MAKFVKGNYSLFTPYTFGKNKTSRDLRLKVPAPKLELFGKNCFYMAPLIYDSLPNCIVDLPYNKFCMELKKWLVGESFYTTREFLEKTACRMYKYNT